MERQRESDIEHGSVLAKIVEALLHATPEQQQDLNQAIEKIINLK